MHFQQLLEINRGLEHCIPNGSRPYQIITRLLEEYVELTARSTISKATA